MLPDWTKISAKVVIIQGIDDDLVPPANADFLVAHLKQEQILKLNLVSGLNHFVPWKRPDLILDGIWTLNETLSDR